MFSTKRPPILQSYADLAPDVPLPLELTLKRHYSQSKLRSSWEDIIAKYSDPNIPTDEIDLETGEIVVDNGHIASLSNSERRVDIWRPSMEEFGEERPHKRPKTNHHIQRPDPAEVLRFLEPPPMCEDCAEIDELEGVVCTHLNPQPPPPPQQPSREDTAERSDANATDAENIPPVTPSWRDHRKHIKVIRQKSLLRPKPLGELGSDGNGAVVSVQSKRAELWKPAQDDPLVDRSWYGEEEEFGGPNVVETEEEDNEKTPTQTRTRDTEIQKPKGKGRYSSTPIARGPFVLITRKDHSRHDKASLKHRLDADESHLQTPTTSDHVEEPEEGYTAEEKEHRQRVLEEEEQSTEIETVYDSEEENATGTIHPMPSSPPIMRRLYTPPPSSSFNTEGVLPARTRTARIDLSSPKAPADDHEGEYITDEEIDNNWSNILSEIAQKSESHRSSPPRPRHHNQNIPQTSSPIAANTPPRKSSPNTTPRPLKYIPSTPPIPSSRAIQLDSSLPSSPFTPTKHHSLKSLIPFSLHALHQKPPRDIPSKLATSDLVIPETPEQVEKTHSLPSPSLHPNPPPKMAPLTPSKRTPTQKKPAPPAQTSPEVPTSESFAVEITTRPRPRTPHTEKRPAAPKAQISQAPQTEPLQRTRHTQKDSDLDTPIKAKTGTRKSAERRRETLAVGEKVEAVTRSERRRQAVANVETGEGVGRRISLERRRRSLVQRRAEYELLSEDLGSQDVGDVEEAEEVQEVQEVEEAEGVQEVEEEVTPVPTKSRRRDSSRRRPVERVEEVETPVPVSRRKSTSKKRQSIASTPITVEDETEKENKEAPSSVLPKRRKSTTSKKRPSIAPTSTNHDAEAISNTRTPHRRSSLPASALTDSPISHRRKSLATPKPRPVSTQTQPSDDEPTPKKKDRAKEKARREKRFSWVEFVSVGPKSSSGGGVDVQVEEVEEGVEEEEMGREREEGGGLGSTAGRCGERGFHCGKMICFLCEDD